MFLFFISLSIHFRVNKFTEQSFFAVVSKSFRLLSNVVRKNGQKRFVQKRIPSSNAEGFSDFDQHNRLTFLEKHLTLLNI